MTDAEIREIAARIYGTLVTEQEFRFARALLASKAALPAMDTIQALFQPWPEGECGPTDEPESQYRFGYNTAIEDALEALSTAPAQSCGDAEQADDPQAVTTDDMEKAVRNSKWGKDIQSRNAFREGWKTALTALPRADEQADEAVTDARDAARYRWLRDKFAFRTSELEPPHWSMDSFSGLGETFDDAIDAAMESDHE
jgi:hypothetical protein